ncbi:hypothetical protein IGI04_020756 [Brassica rapa subsp. trilocularis]|uniref:Uncharacterized protein n=1 Tax=Brassica rapa subsp. trilocularis TaxID=1813537 RepID=A0ABQ7MJN6_BRACM|nr:hypothetical protein IGI04_020756 [Brassica rapa subsp. trilocularis]
MFGLNCIDTGSSTDYTGSTNFTAKYGPVNAYVRFPLSNSHKLDLQRLNIHQLFVQSPSGESFIVLWCLDCMTDKGEAVEWKDKMSNQSDLLIKTRYIMVYRQDTEKGRKISRKISINLM